MYFRIPTLRITGLLTACVLTACAQPSVDTRFTATQSGSARPASSAGLPVGRSAVGEQLAKRPGSVLPQSCIECHGTDGNHPLAPIYPRIGGQYPDYLAHALLAYRGHVRTHPMMTAQASKLSDQDIADLAAYFGSRPGQLRDLATLQ